MARITQKSLERLQGRIARKELSIKINTLMGRLLQEGDPLKRMKIQLEIKQLKFQRQNFGKAA